jgi:hypothetical protein
VKRRGGPLGLLARLHLSPVIWGIILGMLAMLAYCVVHNRAFPPASKVPPPGQRAHTRPARADTALCWLLSPPACPKPCCALPGCPPPL